MQKFLVLCFLVFSCAYSQVYESSGITVVGKRLYDGSLQSGHYGGAQIITSADITASGALTVPDVLQRYGIAKYSNGTGSPLDWTLNWYGFSKGQEIAVVVDGIKVNEADQNDIYWQNIPLSDIERIEIIPGAGSAQYGSGAFAGVLNIVTKKTPQKSVVLETGSYGYGRQGFVLGDIFAENFYYRLDFDNLAASGYRDKSAYNSQRVSGKLGYFSENREINLYYKTADSYAQYPGQLTKDEIANQRTQSIAPANREIKTDQLNLEYIGRLNADWVYALNFGGRIRDLKYTSESRSGMTNIIHAAENNTSYLGQITYRNRITLGYDYRLSQIHSRDFGNVGKIADLSATKGEYATYIQRFRNWKQIYWRYGRREDRVDYVQTDNLLNNPRQKKAFTQRVYNGELGWNFWPEWQVYYAYGEAFKAPTFYDLYGSWGGNSNLTAELARTQLTGLRWQNSFTNFNWQVFETIVSDEIIGVYDPASFIEVNQNAQKTSRTGFNLNIEQKLTEDLQIFANYNYTKARFLKSSLMDWSTVDIIDLNGNVLPQVPEQIYSYGFSYKPGKYSFDLIHNFVGTQYAGSDLQNEFALLPGYSFTNMRLGYNPTEEVNLYLHIHNLFNNIYNTKALAWFDQSDSVTKLIYTPADLRSVMIGVQWLF